MDTIAAPEAMSSMPSARRYGDVSDVSQLLKIAPSTIYTLAREQRIPSLKIGNLVRFDMDRLEEWLESGGSLGEQK